MRSIFELSALETKEHRTCSLRMVNLQVAASAEYQTVLMDSLWHGPQHSKRCNIADASAANLELSTLPLPRYLLPRPEDPRECPWQAAASASRATHFASPCPPRCHCCHPGGRQANVLACYMFLLEGSKLPDMASMKTRCFSARKTARFCKHCRRP